QMLALAAGVLAALAVRVAPSRNLLVLVLLLLAGVAASATMLFGDALMAASWFGATGRTWWADALQDQHRAGAATLVLMALTAARTQCVGGAVSVRGSAGRRSAPVEEGAHGAQAGELRLAVHVRE